MNILSDAEYRQLPESGKTAYWRARYEEKTTECDRLADENKVLRSVIRQIQESVEHLR